MALTIWIVGLQATYTDPLNSLFNADSVQPQYSGQLGETHVFTPNITNQFTFALLWYSAIFTNQNLADVHSDLVPMDRGLDRRLIMACWAV